MLALIHAAVEKGLVVHAQCTGVRVLTAADVLQGKTVTGKGPAEEYAAAGATLLPGQPYPVTDGTIVTAQRGLYYSVNIVEAIAAALESAQPTGAAKEPAGRPQTSQAEEEGAIWSRAFGGPSSEGGRAIAPTSDGGYVVAGYTTSYGAGQSDVYLLKLDEQGQALWAQTLGGPGWEYGYAVVEADDGGYVVTGYTTSSGAGSRDLYLVKTDAQGSEIWSRAFGGPGVDVGYALVATSDGGCLVAGYTQSFGAGETDVYLLKTDAQGNELWSRAIGGPGPDTGRGVIETGDGGYAIVGATGSYGSGNRDVYLVRTDAGGNTLWEKTYGHGATHYDWGSGIHQAGDGGFVLVGHTDAASSGATQGGELMDVYLIRTDALGEEIWSTSLGKGRFYDFGYAVLEADSGDLVVAGATKSSLSGKNDLYLARVDADGEQIWERTYGGAGSDGGSALVEAARGELLVVGHTEACGAGRYDLYVLRVPGE